MLKEYKSIIKNYFANVYGMGVTVLNQIVMVPVFISYWGVEKYGNWILITAFSSFFAMTNLGLNQATNNEFVINYQSDEFKKCNKLLANSFLFILILTLLILIFGAGTAYFIGFKNIFGVTIFNESETNIIFIFLLFNVFAKMFGGIYNGVFRVKHKAHANAIIENSVKLLETMILFFGLFFSLEIFTILLLYNLPILVAICFKHFYSSTYFELSFSIKNFDLQLLKNIVYPSMGFMFIPLSQAMSNQGMILIINSVLGPVILVFFTTTKTLVNFIRSIVDLFANSIYPEISIAWGKKNLNKIIEIFNPTFRITMLSSFFSVALLWLFGEKLFLTWTNNSIKFDDIFFKGMILVTIIVTISKTFSVLLLATNNHNKYTIVFLISQIFIVTLTYITLKFISPDINIIPVIIFFAEILVLVYTSKEVHKIFNYNFKSIIKFNK